MLDAKAYTDTREAAEATSRAAADAALQTAITAEESARMAADAFEANLSLQARNAIQADVDQNEADSDAAHAAATTDRAAVRSEFAAADSSAAATNLAARTVIANGLATEIADRIAAVSAEASARAAADTTLQGNIDSEAARIDAMLNLSTADADSFKEIVDLINSVDTENDNAFGAYVAANDAVVAMATVMFVTTTTNTSPIRYYCV